MGRVDCRVTEVHLRRSRRRDVALGQGVRPHSIWHSRDPLRYDRPARNKDRRRREAATKEEGVSRDAQKGDHIKVHGYKAKAQTAVARAIELPNGKTLSAASKDGGPPQ